VTAAIVTGAARGLGAAVAARLHAGGRAVVLADVDLDGAARGAASLGGRARAQRLDVRNRDAWASCLADTLEAFADVDVLVNNAARVDAGGLFDIEPAEWDDVLAVNVRGAFLGLQVVGEHLRERGGGRVVNVSSDAAFAGAGVTGAHYAASKAALLALTRRAAAELAPHGITVNAVAPGALEGEAARSLVAGLDGAAASLPVGRLGRPEEVASLIGWLVSDDAGFVTGATFRIDGGSTL
jgi:3-oxoacyl-[acyl-carrier protein] reductase